MTPVLRRIALGAAWVACTLAVALGSAGIVAGLSAPPASSARAELTWAADRAIAPGLAAARADLVGLSADVDALGLQGRAALAGILARDPDIVDSTVAEGRGLVASIQARSAAIGLRLAGLPGAGAGMEGRFGRDTIATYEGIAGAAAMTGGLDTSWATLTAGSAAALRLADLLERHDVDAAAAARLGSRGSYADALDRLAPAKAALDTATELRDELANTSDVSVLDQWIARNRALDTALQRLYQALRDAHGTVTPAVRAAVAAESAAQKELPPDTRALVVIMSDLARGGLNQAVIAIEQTKGDLAAAIAGLPADAP